PRRGCGRRANGTRSAVDRKSEPWLDGCTRRQLEYEACPGLMGEYTAQTEPLRSGGGTKRESTADGLRRAGREFVLVTKGQPIVEEDKRIRRETAVGVEHPGADPLVGLSAEDPPIAVDVAADFRADGRRPWRDGLRSDR